MGNLDMANPPHPKGMLITDAKVAMPHTTCHKVAMCHVPCAMVVRVAMRVAMRVAVRAALLLFCCSPAALPLLASCSPALEREGAQGL
jgi:hypothetical protein